MPTTSLKSGGGNIITIVEKDTVKHEANKVSGKCTVKKSIIIYFR